MSAVIALQTSAKKHSEIRWTIHVKMFELIGSSLSEQNAVFNKRVIFFIIYQQKYENKTGSSKAEFSSFISRKIF